MIAAVPSLNAVSDDLDVSSVADDAAKNKSKRSGTKHLTSNKNKLREQKQHGRRPTKIYPESTEHMVMYKQIIYFFGVLGKFFGTAISYNWKPRQHFMYYFTFLLLYCCAFQFFYTVYWWYNSGDYLRIVEPLAIIGLLISCSLKWFSHLRHWRKIFSLFFFARKLCLENVTGDRAAVIIRGLRRTRTILKAYTVGVIALLCFYVTVPAKYFLMNDRFIQLLPLEIVYIDQSTSSGFLLAAAIHVTLGVFSGVATIMFGSGFLICVCNYGFLVDLIQLDLTDLDEMWKDSSTTIRDRHAHLNNVCKKLQDMKSSMTYKSTGDFLLSLSAYAIYLKVVKVIYERNFFLFFIAVLISEALCFYEITENDWIPGYTIGLMLLVEMMFYCVVGTQISIADDKLCYMVYATNWHTYDMKSQKTIQTLLHDCQQSKHLQLGTLGPLSVVTCVKVVKSIYSYYTLMQEMM